MSTSQKKLVYGLFYLLVFALIGWGVFALVSGGEGPSAGGGLASCFDGIINQEESGVDCGGPCAPCREVVDESRSLQVRDAEFFSVGADKVTLVAKVLNPSGDYGVSSFSYDFLVYNVGGELLEVVRDSDVVYPGEARFVYAPAVGVSAKEVDNVDVEVSEVVWQPASNFTRPSVSLTRDPEVVFGEDSIEVAGVLENQSGFSVFELKVVAVLYDEFGFKAFVAETFVSNIVGFKEREFTVVIPYDSDLVRRTREGSVDVFLYPVR